MADLWATLLRLIRNELLLLRMLSGILHILPIAGFYTFLPKYLVEQFRITSSSASAISGLAGILFVGFGAFLGGTVVRVFNVNSKLMTRWIASAALLYSVGMLLLMNLGCPNNRTVHYYSQDFTATDCSTVCRCSNEIYDPVCANGTTYLSPCLAGCQSYTASGDRIVYDECGCSPRSLASPELTNRSNSFNLDRQKPIVEHVNLNVATRGYCSVDCGNLIWYVIIFSLFNLIHASCEVGSMMFNLRCVRSCDRTLALGLITFSSSLLGTIPCSVIYGTIIDMTCVHWETHIEPVTMNLVRGACRAYDNDKSRYYLHAVTALIMFFAFVVDCIISRRANEVDFYHGGSNSKASEARLRKSTESIQRESFCVLSSETH